MPSEKQSQQTKINLWRTTTTPI